MRRFFAKNLLFVISVNLLVKPLWIFLIDRTVQNRVGHASYGLYQALFNLGIIFNIFLDFGINYYNSKTLAQYPKKIKTLFPAMLTARLIMSLIYVLAVCAIGLILGYRGWQVILLIGILVIQALSSVLLFIRSNISGLHKFKADGILSVIDRFLMIIVCGVLLFTPFTSKHFKIEWFVAAQIVCYGLAIIIGLIVLKKIANIPLRFSLDHLRVFSIIKQSYPFAQLIFLMAVYTRADSMLIERLCGPQGDEQAGIYAAAYRLLDVGNMFGIMFGSMLLPIFGRMLSQKQDVLPIVQLCLNLLLPGALIVTISGIFFSSEIMHMLYHQATEMDAMVFTLLMSAFPAFSVINIYATLLTANGNLKLLSKIAFAGVLINLSLNFTLIPQYFSLGAAITTSITQNILVVCFIAFTQKQLKLPFHIKWWQSCALFMILLLAAGYGVKMLPIHWATQLLLLLATGAFFMMLFRFVSLKAIKQLMGQK